MKKDQMKKTALLMSTALFLCGAVPSYGASPTGSEGGIIYQSSPDGETITLTQDITEETLGFVETATGVTEEMCHSVYWYDRNEGFGSADKLLITPEEIEKLNYDSLHTKGTNMYDLKNMPTDYNALTLRNSLAASILNPNDNRLMSKTQFYADQKLISDPKGYCQNLYNAVSGNGYDEENRQIQYAVAIKRTPVRSVPVREYIGFTATDGDDEVVNSAININEPFIIKQKATVSGNDFYWGYTDNCTGWVDAMDLAVCQNRDEWLDAWDVDPLSDDFIIVTQNQIRLEPSVYVPATSEVKLTFATILKSVSKDGMPKKFTERGSWNNHVVYLPTRDENGRYVKSIALISQHYDVHEGYLDMTQANLMDLAFNSLGDRYGWGGMLDSMDCSLFTHNVYKCFGLYLPRNTTWQQLLPGKAFSFDKMTDEQKLKAMYYMPAGTLFYFPGHTMIYTGTDNKMAYVISDTGTLSDSVGDLNLKSMYSVLLNPLSVRRKNGNTWLTNLTTAVLPISKENYDQVMLNIAEDPANSGDEPGPEPKPTPTPEPVPTPKPVPKPTPEPAPGPGYEKQKQVTPLNGQSFASSFDTLALDTFMSSSRKLFIDFSNVKGSGVDTLSVSCIKKSKITTKAPVKEVICDKAVAKVKIDKNTSLATLTLKSSGPVTFRMADDAVYTVHFTTETPKAQKAAKTFSVSENGIQTLSLMQLFKTRIDGGELRIEKDAQNTSSVSGNTLLINTSQKNKLKVSYKYLDKKYRISISVK